MISSLRLYCYCEVAQFSFSFPFRFETENEVEEYTHFVEYTIIGRRGSRVRVDAASRVTPRMNRRGVSVCAFLHPRLQDQER